MQQFYPTEWLGPNTLVGGANALQLNVPKLSNFSVQKLFSLYTFSGFK